MDTERDKGKITQNYNSTTLSVNLYRNIILQHFQQRVDAIFERDPGGIELPPT
jgi:hypothetical protein